MHAAAGADCPAGDAACPPQARRAARKALLARLLADAGGAAGGALVNDDTRLEAVLRDAEARAAAAGADAAAHARACAALGFDTRAGQQWDWRNMLLLLHADKIEVENVRAQASQRLTAFELRVAAGLCALVTKLLGEQYADQQATAADAARAKREAAAERAAAKAAAAADAADVSFAPGDGGEQATLARLSAGYGCAAGGTRSRKAVADTFKDTVYEVD